jgi:hypothetical protein
MPARAGLVRSWNVRSPARVSLRAEIAVDVPQFKGKWCLAPLRADDDVGLARLDLLDDVAHLDERGHEVGGQYGEPRVGKPLGNLLGDALNPRTARDQRIWLAALGALLGDRQREAAMVALEPVPVAVLDQPGGAPGTRSGGRKSAQRDGA